MRALLSEMSWAQFYGWTIYSSLEPFGSKREDLRAGVVASVIANVNRDSQKRAKPFQPFEFFPEYVEARGAAILRSQPVRTTAEWGAHKSMFQAIAESESRAAALVEARDRKAQERRDARRAAVEARRTSPQSQSPSS